MTKSELIEKLAEQHTNIPAKDVEDAVKEVIEQMSDSLSSSDRIEIRGFGSFVSKQYGARTGRNPRTGATIDVPAKRLPLFKVGKELRERVDKQFANQPDAEQGSVPDPSSTP